MNPVARVLVDSPLPHLDRPFDYLVPDEFVDDTRPGVRVTVRFAGKKVGGYVLDVVEHSDHDGKLAPLVKVVSPEPVLSPEVALLARAAADRWVGTMADVLRLAIPPRHARAEAHPAEPPVQPGPEVIEAGHQTWHAYVHGSRVVEALGRGESPRVVLTSLPRHEPARAVAEAVAATLRSGRGSIVCVPDARDLAAWDAVFTAVLGPGQHRVLSAADSASDRYKAFLAVSRGTVRVVLGTRAAAWSPVQDLGLVAMWDDGDDSHVEPRAPYAHTREVLLLRATRTGAGVVLAGYARTAEAQSLVTQGWAELVEGDQIARRREWPLVTVVDGSEAGAAPVRLPRQVFQAIRDADGPVLVQVPRRGYRSGLSCQTCRTPARCRACEGPLQQPSAHAAVVCRWCATVESPWRCRQCGGQQFRAPVVGALRTAEEFAQAFDRPVVTSSGSSIVDTVDHPRALVLATPGAEPTVPGGYRAIVLLDTWLMLARDDVRVVEESHRRWFGALALAAHGAPAVVVGETTVLQALVRADPGSVAVRELEARADTHLPPVGRLALLEGAADDLEAVAPRLAALPAADVLGPVPIDDRQSRLVVRVPRRHGAELSAALRSYVAERSAAKRPVVRVHIDPHGW